MAKVLTDFDWDNPSPPSRKQSIRGGELFLGNNLVILQGMDTNSVDLIYFDPPFNTGKDWGAFDDNWRKDNVSKDYAKTLAISHPKLLEFIQISEYTHSVPMVPYLLMMATRLLEMKRVLKNSGSIYLHCDPTASHYLKVMMDSIFGIKNFRNEIVWCYPPGGRAPKRALHKKHDTLLYYGSIDGTWNKPYGPMPKATLKTYSKIDSDGRRYKTYGDRRTYLDTIKGRPVPSWWVDIPSLGVATRSKERLGYPTQKPLKLLERIIKASSNPGDVVLDPFCGSGTTLEAAQKLNRSWIGIDSSETAIDICRKRLGVENG